ncbi:hypothetical protein PLICRDRAFT_532040 [Plicaturopsis crispa FD-325 SS-3]|nr:hypothetical protein PLICRDRAFT_532040 [Plicaturopsis crispa FD-325 SS-3]
MSSKMRILPSFGPFIVTAFMRFCGGGVAASLEVILFSLWLVEGTGNNQRAPSGPSYGTSSACFHVLEDPTLWLERAKHIHPPAGRCGVTSFAGLHALNLATTCRLWHLLRPLLAAVGREWSWKSWLPLMLISRESADEIYDNMGPTHILAGYMGVLHAASNKSLFVRLRTWYGHGIAPRSL